MLSKEGFCKALQKIKEQESIDEQFSKALDLVGNGHFVFGAENKYLLALRDVFEKVPIFEPGNSGFKNGNFSFILGSRKELRFVLNRSFHVQLSMRSVTVVKFDILF